jgi:excisionase family DNA binding protein
MNERLLLKPEEAAQLLGISRSKAYLMIAGGELPAVRLGRFTRVPLDALKEWVAAHSRTAEQTRG